MKFYSKVEIDFDGEHIILLPDELLNELDWKEGDLLEWKIEGDTIILSKEVNNNDKSDSGN